MFGNGFWFCWFFCEAQALASAVVLREDLGGHCQLQPPVLVTASQWHSLTVTVMAGGGRAPHGLSHGQSVPTPASNTTPEAAVVPGPCWSPWLSLTPNISKKTSLGLDE